MKENKLFSKFSHIILLLYSFIYTIKCPTPGMAPSGRYLSTGMFNVVSDALTQTYTISLGSYPKSSPTYDVALSMSSLQLWFNGNSLALQLNVVSTAQSSFNVFINNTNGPSLKALTINFISRQPTYVDAFYIKTFRSPDYNQNLAVTAGGPGFQYVYSLHGQTLPSLANVIKRTLLSGFNILSANSGSNNDFDLNIFCQYVNATHYVSRFTTTYDPYTVKFYQIAAVFYQDTTIQNNKLSNFIHLYKTSNTNSAPLKFTDAAGFIQSFNIFMGISIFHVHQTPTNWVKFTSAVVNSTFFDITTTNNIVGKWMEFQGLLILSWSCNNPSDPWFDLASKQCLGACTPPLYPNPSTGTCMTCSSIITNCLSCNFNGSATLCQSCAPTYGLTSSNTCQPCINYLTGCQACSLTPSYTCTACLMYYANFTAGTCTLNCSITDSQCQTCNITSGTLQCLTCFTNYTQSSPNNCTLNCSITSAYCQNCTFNSTVQCTACIANYIVINSTCQIDCTIPDVNCYTCHQNASTVVCDTCLTYYDLINQTCVLNCSYADPKCQNCSFNATTLQCTGCLTNYAFVNSTCQIDCTIPDVNCYTCHQNASTVVCDTCLTYYDLINQTCVLNCSYADPKCQNCTVNTTLQCTNCVTNYTLVNQTCQIDCNTAIPGCNNCTLNGTNIQCLSCAPGYLFVNQTCSLNCTPAHINCLTCHIQGSLKCLTCQTGYALVGPNNCDLCSSLIPNCTACSQVNSTSPASYLCSNCTAGYIVVSNSCIPGVTPTPSGPSNFLLKYEYIIKQPSSNDVFLFFTLQPNDPSALNLYKTINWTAAVQTDILFSHLTVQFIEQPQPHLKIGGPVLQQLQGKQKSVNLTGYNPLIYPTALSSLTLTEIKLVSLKSKNNLALKIYSDDTYLLSKVFSYICILVTALYLLMFLLGFVCGKLYILQAGAVVQVTFLSLVFMKSLSPTMQSLMFLKCIFGYNYQSQTTSSAFSQEVSINQSSFAAINISTYFIYNYNIMFIFLIASLIIFLVIKFTSPKVQQQEQIKTNFKLSKVQKRKNMFFLSIPIYFTLWFGLWVFTTGEIQMKNISNDLQIQGLKYIGLIFFVVNLVLYAIYAVFYMKNYFQIEQFCRYFKKNSTSKQQKIIAQYFYTLIFIQKVVIASLCANMFSLKFGNGIILGENILFIILLILFKPYIYNKQALQLQNTKKEQSSKQNFSALKPNIRQVLNYGILGAIMALFMITNYFQQSQGGFILYMPIIILALLLLNLGITIFFLISDGVLKADLINLKAMFLSQQAQKAMLKQALQQKQQQITSRKLNPDQIKQVRQQLSQQKTKKSGFNPVYDDYKDKKQIKTIKSIQQQTPKDQQQQDSQQEQLDEIAQIQARLKQQLSLIHQQSFYKHLSIDEMLAIMAQKSYQKQKSEGDKSILHSQKSNSKNNSFYEQQQSESRIKKHHQIMKQVKSSSNSSKSLIDQQWDQLQDVDSSRMDKLIKFNERKNKNLLEDKDIHNVKFQK